MVSHLFVSWGMAGIVFDVFFLELVHNKKRTHGYTWYIPSKLDDQDSDFAFTQFLMPESNLHLYHKSLAPSPRCHNAHEVLPFRIHHRCKQGTQKNRKLQSIQGLPNGFVQILLPTKDILSRKSQTLTQICTLKLGTIGTASRQPIFQTKRLFVEKHLLALQSNELLTPGIQEYMT